MKMAIIAVTMLVLSGASTVAYAGQFENYKAEHHDGWTPRQDWDLARANAGLVPATALTVPEISASAAFVVLALLGGALIALRGRHSAKPKN